MQREHDGVLAAVARAFAQRSIVVIGAAALRWHYPVFRGTLDLDLCIAIDLEEHTQARGLPEGWVRQAGMPHRWRMSDGQLLDILPAADGLLRAGRVEWPDGIVMDLAGIDLAMRDHLRYSDKLPANVVVASRRALFVTKVVAWLDRPSERQKDLGDLAMLLDDYVDLEDPRRFDTTIPDGLDWSERPAFLLGRDLHAICAEHHRLKIREFVRRVTAPDSRDRHWLLQAAPSWREDERAMPGRIGALLVGLEES